MMLSRLAFAAMFLAAAQASAQDRAADSAPPSRIGFANAVLGRVSFSSRDAVRTS